MFETLQGLYAASLVPIITIGWPLCTLDFVILTFNLTCVYLVGRNNIANYPIGLVGITAYMFMCFSLGFYSEFFLQIYLFIASLIGWYMWRNRGSHTLQPRVMPKISYLLIVLVWAGSTIILGSNIDKFFMEFVNFIEPLLTLINSGTPVEYVHSPASYPYYDALTTTGQILAMILMVRKYVESWVLWIIVNAISVPLFIMKGGYGIAIMFAIFFILAVMGLIKWINLINQQRKPKSPISDLHS